MKIIYRILSTIFDAPKKDSLFKLIFESIIIFLCLRTFVFDIFTVPESVFNSSIKKNEKLLIWKLGYNFNNNCLPYFGFDIKNFNFNLIYSYSRFDSVVYFDTNTSKYKIATIIGNHNDQLTSKNNEIFINNTLYYRNNILSIPNYHITIPKDRYVILCQENNQITFNIIKSKHITGKCFLYLLPTKQEYNSILHILYELPSSINWSKIFTLI